MLRSGGRLAELTEAVADTAPICVGFTTIVTVASAPEPNVPSLHCRLPRIRLAWAHCPWDGVVERTRSLPASLMLKLTSPAASGPELWTVIVYVSARLITTGSGASATLTPTSAPVTLQLR